MLGIGGAVWLSVLAGRQYFSFKSMFDTPENEDKDAFEFYGRVQAGITTPTQKL